MDFEFYTFVTSVGILAVNIIFYSKKWRVGDKA